MRKCKICQRNKVATKGWRTLADGAKVRKYKAVCNACYERKRKGLSGPAVPKVANPLKSDRYKKHKGKCCELCGFVALHPRQLDVDHKDGNGANHDPNNLQTLCANCHRLKTILCGDHMTPRTVVQIPHQTSLDALWGAHSRDERNVIN